MANIDIRHYIKAQPRSSKLRQRRRKLRPIKPSRKNELWYKAVLLAIVNQLRSATRALYADMKNAVDKVTLLQRDGMVLDANVVTKTALYAMIQLLAQKFGNINNQAKQLAYVAAVKNAEEVDARLAQAVKQSVGIDIAFILKTSPYLQTAMAQASQDNIELIKSIPSQYFEKLHNVITSEYTEGSRWEDLVEAIEHIGDVTETRAKIIARDQTSKMNSSFNKVRQTSLGIESYIWQTSGDERVRDSHAQNDGKVFQWNDPPEETGNPGEDVLCRCTAIPYFDIDNLELNQE